MAVLLKENEEQILIEPEEIVEEDYDDTPWPFVYEYDEEGYLISDGQPMAEHDINRDEMSDTIAMLKAHFRNRVAYVSGNNFIHYKMGSRTKCVSPDCYVVFDVKQAPRANYKSWMHGGKRPAVIFEFTSRKTKENDTGEKFLVYEQALRTPEYILFDPQGDYLTPKLKIYWLNGAGRYEPMEPDANGRIYSEQMDLYLEAVGEELLFFDAKTGEYLRTPAEEAQQRVKEKACADEEARRAAQEARARRQEKKRADEEVEARQKAEAEIALLRAELVVCQGSTLGYGRCLLRPSCPDFAPCSEEGSASRTPMAYPYLLP